MPCNHSPWLTAKEVKFGGGQVKNYALERIARHNRNKRAKEKEQEWADGEGETSAAFVNPRWPIG